MNISDRLTHVPASPIRKLVPFAQEAKKRGTHVYHLNIGDPDIKTPQVMLDVLTHWTANPIAYDLSQGNPAFLHALAWYYQNLGYPFVTEQQIQVTTGGSEAISMALFATCQAGDEVLVFEPFYANYNSFAATTGVTLIPVPTTIQNGFHLPDEKEIERHITPKTRAILYCNPNNPTGTVYTKEEIGRLVAIAKQRNLFLLSDEVYREFTYDGRQHASLLSFMQEIPDRAVVLDSLSKRYSLCGARLGCIVTLNQSLLDGVLRMAQGRLCSAFIEQVMAATLTKVPADYFTGVHREYEQRRNLLYRGLSEIPGVTVPKPEGAFYTIVGLPVNDAETFCTWLLTDFSDGKETVMLAPADGFYASPGMGKKEVRIAYVLNTTALTRSIALLGKALTVYNTKKP